MIRLDWGVMAPRRPLSLHTKHRSGPLKGLHWDLSSKYSAGATLNPRRRINIYIYIYRERERERERKRLSHLNIYICVYTYLPAPRDQQMVF